MRPTARSTSSSVLFLLAATQIDCGNRDNAERLYAPSVVSDGGTYSTRIHTPASLQGIQGNTQDSNGNPVDIACSTCHRGRTFPLPTTADAVRGPHVGLRFQHGTNTCGACHDPTDAERLRLADGRTLPLTDAMALCSQCHGPQARDYQHGAHGGMNGFWDLRRGARVRNHCADCHDPHAPAFPSFLPMPAPLDAPRQLGAASHGASHE